MSMMRGGGASLMRRMTQDPDVANHQLTQGVLRRILRFAKPYRAMITVFITVTIMVLKVFDIVYVLTNGRFETNVIANLFYNEAFANGQNGRAAAIVVVLLIAVMPVLIYQVRHFRAEEANR